MLRNSTNRRNYTKKKVSVPVVTVRLAVTSSSVRGGLNSNVVLGNIVGLNTTIVHNLELQNLSTLGNINEIGGGKLADSSPLCSALPDKDGKVLNEAVELTILNDDVIQHITKTKLGRKPIDGILAIVELPIKVRLHAVNVKNVQKRLLPPLVTVGHDDSQKDGSKGDEQSLGSKAADDIIPIADSNQLDLAPLTKAGHLVPVLSFELPHKDLKVPGEVFAGNGLHKPLKRDYNKETVSAKNFDHKGNEDAKNDGAIPKAHIDDLVVHCDTQVGNSDATELALVVPIKIPKIDKKAQVHLEVGLATQIPITLLLSDYPKNDEEGQSCCQVTLTVSNCKQSTDKASNGNVIVVIEPILLKILGHLDLSKGVDNSKPNVLKVKESRVKVDVTLKHDGQSIPLHNVDGGVKLSHDVAANQSKNNPGTDVVINLTLIPQEPCDVAINCQTKGVPCIGRQFDHLLVENHSRQSHLIVVVDGNGLNDGDHKNLVPDDSRKQVVVVLSIDDVNKSHQQVEETSSNDSLVTLSHHLNVLGAVLSNAKLGHVPDRQNSLIHIETLKKRARSIEWTLPGSLETKGEDCKTFVSPAARGASVYVTGN